MLCFFRIYTKYARKVKKGAGVAQNQADKLERRPLLVRVRGRGGIRLPRAGLVGDEPAKKANDVDSDQADEVLYPGLRVENVVTNVRLGL